MRPQLIFFLILGLDGLTLIYQTSEISISYREALILYGDISPLQILVKISLFLFGQNDFSLRLPTITIHLLSVILLFNISKQYIKKDRNRLWLVLIFILLPGVLSSALILDKAALIIFGLLLFIWAYQKQYKMFYYPLLASYTFLDNNFTYLFLALSIYSIFAKERQFFIFNIIIFFISAILFGIDVHGSPTGHFIDSLALYSAIFSPIVFIYIIFVLYKRYFLKNIDIVWFIAVVPFLISLLFSFRQNIHIEHFAPYLIIALPLAAQSFISAYRVRLKMFRSNYRIIFIISFIFLILNSFVVIFNKDIYRFIDNPKHHFVYNFHIAKELAQKLKENSINCVDTNRRMQKRLYFYGVTKCDKYKLSRTHIDSRETKTVTISYRNTPVFLEYVTKINN